MKGTVKWYDTKKGYGFITGEDEQDYFVHFTAVPEQTFLRENDIVSFEAVETERGKQAQNVVLEQKGSEVKSEAPGVEEKAPEEPAGEEEAAAEDSEDFGEE